MKLIPVCLCLCCKKGEFGVKRPTCEAHKACVAAKTRRRCNAQRVANTRLKFRRNVKFEFEKLRTCLTGGSFFLLLSLARQSAKRPLFPFLDPATVRECQIMPTLSHLIWS